MKFLSFLLCFALGIPLCFSQPLKIKPLLPSPLNSFELNKTKLSEVEKALGPAALKEKENHYWVRGGLKYALKLSFDQNNVLKSLDFTFTEKWPPLEKLGPIDTKKLLPYPSDGKSAGRYLLFKEKGSEVLIDPATNTIQGVKLL
jgi:hypothetical protein